MNTIDALRNPQNHQERRDLGATERLARSIGSAVLGIYGVAMQIGGTVSLNPIAVGLGTGSVLLAEKISRPYLNEVYGEPTHDQSKTKRFLRYNASLIPTYIGAVLLGNAVFKSSLSIAQRLASVALSVPSFIGGNIMEKKAHTGEPYLNSSARRNAN